MLSFTSLPFNEKIYSQISGFHLIINKATQVTFAEVEVQLEFEKKMCAQPI